MDFRKVGLAALKWGSAWYRGQPLARIADSKVVVQTPCAPCRVSFATGGMLRVDLSFLPGVKAHDQFLEWLDDVERTARESPAMAEWRGDRRFRACVFRNSLRLMAFADTLAFDATGALSADLVHAASCACLVELQGCWKTDEAWGVRWKIQQIKFDTTPPDFPVATATKEFAFVADDDSSAVREFAFVDDPQEEELAA